MSHEHHSAQPLPDATRCPGWVEVDGTRYYCSMPTWAHGAAHACPEGHRWSDGHE